MGVHFCFSKCTNARTLHRESKSTSDYCVSAAPPPLLKRTPAHISRPHPPSAANEIRRPAVTCRLRRWAPRLCVPTFLMTTALRTVLTTASVQPPNPPSRSRLQYKGCSGMVMQRQPEREAQWRAERQPPPRTISCSRQDDVAEVEPFCLQPCLLSSSEARRRV